MKRIFTCSVVITTLLCDAHRTLATEKQERSATLELTLVDEDNDKPLPRDKGARLDS